MSLAYAGIGKAQYEQSEESNNPTLKDRLMYQPVMSIIIDRKLKIKHVRLKTSKLHY